MQLLQLLLEHFSPIYIFNIKFVSKRKNEKEGEKTFPQVDISEISQAKHWTIKKL